MRRLLLPGRLDALFGADSAATAAGAEDDARPGAARPAVRPGRAFGGVGSGGGPGGALRGECVAAAVKLHVNVEGGFGPSWEAQHVAQTALLFAAADALAPSGLKSLARCLAGADALPVCRTSRAFAALQPLFDHAAACCPVATLQGATAPTAAKKKRNKSRNGSDLRQPVGSRPSTIQSQLPAFFPPEAKQARAAPGGAKGLAPPAAAAAAAAAAAEGKEGSRDGGGAKGVGAATNGQVSQARAESKAGGLAETNRYSDESNSVFAAEAKGERSATDAKGLEEDDCSEDEDDDSPEAASSALAAAVAFATVDFGEAASISGTPPHGEAPTTADAANAAATPPTTLGWVGSDAFLANRPWRPRTLAPLAGAPVATPGLRT